MWGSYESRVDFLVQGLEKLFRDRSAGDGSEDEHSEPQRVSGSRRALENLSLLPGGLACASRAEIHAWVVLSAISDPLEETGTGPEVIQIARKNSVVVSRGRSASNQSRREFSGLYV